MDYKSFQGLLEIEDKDQNKFFQLKEGDIFLEGSRMINQKVERKIGEEVCYYVIIGTTGHNGKEFRIVYDRLEP